MFSLSSPHPLSPSPVNGRGGTPKESAHGGEGKDGAGPIFRFLILTFALSWTIAAVYHFTGGTWNTPQALAVATLYMFCPILSAFIIQRSRKENFKEAIAARLSWNRWYVLAWLLPFALFGLTLLASLALPGVEFTKNLEGLFERFSRTMSPDQLATLKSQMAALPFHPVLVAGIQALVAGISVNALAAFGEEAGWRGFLYGKWEHLGFFRSALFIGLIWGIWHAPLILLGHNYPDHPVAGVFMMTLLCVLFSPLLSFVRLKTGSSVAAAILHGSFNATAGLPLMLMKGGNDLLIGTMGAAGLFALAIADLGIFLYFKKSSGIR